LTAGPASGEAAAHAALRGALSAVALPEADAEQVQDMLFAAMQECALATDRLHHLMLANSLDGSLRCGVEAVLAGEAAVASIAAIVARLVELRAATSAVVREVRHVLGETMDGIGQPSIGTRHHLAAPLGPIGRVEIQAPAELPAEFWRTREPEPDKLAILNALRAGQAVPGARLDRGRVSLRITMRKE
jgi:hypothetical protein